MEIKSFDIRCIKEVSELLFNCKPYVLPHNPYIYWMMGEYFPSLCFTAQDGGVTAGFICSLYSAEKDSVFIWQLAVSKEYRGSGTAVLLCDKIIEYAVHKGVESLQFTINDKNTASISFFSSLAKKYDLNVEKIALKGLNDFEGENAYMIKF